MSRNYDLLRAVQGRTDLKVRHSLRPQLRPVATQSVPTSQPAASRRISDIAWALGVIRRRWLLCVAFTAVVVTATAVVSFRLKPVYEPQASVEVDPAGSEVFSLQSGSSEVGDMDRIMQTQVEILNGDELAVKLVRQMRLDTRPDVAGKLAVPRGSTLPQDPNARESLTPAENAALEYVRKHLKAVAAKASRMINISFSSHSARLSRDVVNNLVQLYLERNYESRYKAVAESSEWLSRQLADIRDKAEKSSQKLADYQRRHNITDIDQQQNSFAVKVGDLTRQLTQSQADRIQLEAYYNSIQKGEGDSLPQVRDNPVIQNLTRNLADTQTQLSQAKVIYGQNHPNVQKLDNAAKEQEAQLERERNSIMEGVKTSYTAAKAREALMADQLQSTSADVSAMGEYSLLKHEAQANTDLYNTLYGRVKEAGIVAASKSSNIRLMEPARLLNEPSSPNPLQNIAVALLFGLVGGVVMAFVRDNFDTSIRRPEEISLLGSMPPVAFIPRVHPALPTAPARSRKADLAKPWVVRSPKGDGAEAVRSLVSSLLLGTEAVPRVLLVVSGLPQEGKTTLAVNMAVVLSELAPTCIVDADLRRPTVGPNFGLQPGPGLVEALTDGMALEAVTRAHPGAPNLGILTARGGLSNPGAALMSDAMGDVVSRLRSRFTYVVIDSPPILGYADARALVPLSDGVIMVARYAQTTRDAINRTMDILRQLHAPVLAFALNEVDGQASYYKYK